MENLDRHLDGKPPTTEGQKDGGQTPSDKDLTDAIEALKKKVAERFNDKDSEEQRKALDKQLEAFEKLNDAIKEQSAPLDQLSPEAQKAIEEEFKKLSREDKEALKQKAKELLEDLEDKLRDSMESELQENAPERHQDRRRAAEEQRRAAERDKILSLEIEKMKAERQEMLGAWDRMREGIASQVNTLFSRLERILRPTVPEWEAGHPSGTRVNPFAVMQAKADRRLITKIWDRKSLPLEKSFAFSLLVDVSGSMQENEKSKYAGECAVLMSEVLTRLKVPFEMAIFNDSSELIKQFEKTPKKEGKNEIAGKLSETSGGTKDFLAVEERTRGLIAREEENKFLIVITDGGSADGARLTKVLEQALKSNVRVIALGIGPATSDVDRYYPIGRGGLSVDRTDKENALVPYFSKIMEEILTNPEKFIRDKLREKAFRTNGGENG